MKAVSGMKPASIGSRRSNRAEEPMNSMKRLAHAYQTTPWRKQISSGMIVVVGLLVVILGASLYLDVSARASAYGRAILIMENQIVDLEIINAHLRSQLGMLTSSSVMEKRAIEMGFRRLEPEEEMYLVVPGYVPMDQVTMVASPKQIPAASVTLPKIYTESLVDWLKSKIQNMGSAEMENSP